MNIRLNLGFSTLLFLVFLVLRLTDQVDWAWYWVASPIWIGWGLSLVLLAVFAVLAVLVA
jgi:hypothetical protein